MTTRRAGLWQVDFDPDAIIEVSALNGSPPLRAEDDRAEEQADRVVSDAGVVAGHDGPH
jgi:hypothetical protein